MMNNKVTPFLSLLIKSLILLVLLNVAEIAYHLYNPLYPVGFNTTRWLSNGNMWILLGNGFLYIVLIGILLIQSFWLRTGILFLLFFVMLLEFLYYQYFGTYIQPIGFYQFFVNTGEVFLSFADEIPAMIIPAIIVLFIGISVFVTKALLCKKSYRNTALGISILLVVGVSSFYYAQFNLSSSTGKLSHRQESALLPLPALHSTTNFARASTYFLAGILPKKILSKDAQLFTPLPMPVQREVIPQRNIILIIGESLRAKELGILGYEENTTPRLSAIKSLYSSSIYAAGTMTKSSVSAILNRVKYPGATDQMTTQKNNLFFLAKQNGFETFFYSRQTKGELSVLQNFIGRKYIDHYASRSDLETQIKDASRYDFVLKQALASISIEGKSKFIVLHQRGSHSPHKDQYPKQYEHFDKPYDNTVLYTDYVLSEIIKYLEVNSKKPTYIIATSDHGELLHEHGRNGHGWFFPEVFNIPFIYSTTHADKDKNILVEPNKIKSHFEMSSTVAYLLGYDLNISIPRDVYVNGSDVDALAGYMHIELDEKGNQLSSKVVR